MNLRRLSVVGFILMTASAALAQTPAFEVSSVKPNTSGARNSSSSTLPGGRGFRATNVTLRQLILSAYRLRPLQLLGGPSWLDSERFDIDARAPENGPSDQVLNMLRAMLADRFKLVVHNETKDQPIYALVLARADKTLGPQLKSSTVDCSPGSLARAGGGGAGVGAPAAPVVSQPISCGTNTNVSNAGGIMKAGARSMSDLATTLASFVADRMVVDQTGLSGIFDLELRWTPDNLQPAAPDPAAATPDAPSIFAALQEQLGLKLESRRGPVEFLVIDSVERPTSN